MAVETVTTTGAAPVAAPAAGLDEAALDPQPSADTAAQGRPTARLGATAAGAGPTIPRTDPELENQPVDVGVPTEETTDGDGGTAGPTPEPEPADPPEDAGREAMTAPTPTEMDDAEPYARWCSDGAIRVRDAFATTIMADRPGRGTLREALEGLLEVLVAVQSTAPEELQWLMADAIESQILVNATLEDAAWDRTAVDWSSVPAEEQSRQTTKVIDQYGAELCRLRAGFLLPED